MTAILDDASMSLEEGISPALVFQVAGLLSGRGDIGRTLKSFLSKGTRRETSTPRSGQIMFRVRMMMLTRV